MALTTQQRNNFFASLYEDTAVGSHGNFDKAATRLVAKGGSHITVGDHALQSLLFNFVLTKGAGAANPGLTAALAGIKQMAVEAFTKAFPGSSVDTLIADARASGFDVQVLK